MSEGDRISPTAHYTGYVWARNGLSHPRLSTIEGRLLFESSRGMNAVSAGLGGPSLERYLLARHRSIDRLLREAIQAGTVSQVIEIACGLSPRGWRFTREFGDAIEYVEADLPGMVARKRDALERMDSLGDRHRVAVVDALIESGQDSLPALFATLDPDHGTAVITEGLLGYLDTPSVLALWQRIAAGLHTFPAGRYLSDLHLGSGTNVQIRAFRQLLSAFVRGQVHLHFDDEPEAVTALRDAGFDDARLTTAAELSGHGEKGGGAYVHIIEASTVRSQ